MTPRPTYLNLIAAGEPYRLLFPLGTCLGLVGVLLWPLHVWHVTSAYPGVMHNRLMIEGFMSCFVFGFLGTALPRLLGVPRLSLAETVSFALALVGTATLHLTGHTRGGDELFLLTLLGFITCLALRAFWRKDIPPPGFVLVALGLLSAVIGTGLQILLQLVPSSLSPTAAGLARLLHFQGYLLLPVMGVGAFLLPRFFGLPSRQNFPESLTPPPGWTRSAAFALACGLAVLTSFVLETQDWMRAAYALRSLAVLVYLFREVPVHRAALGSGTLAIGLRLALVSIPLGYALMAVWPEQGLTLLHIVFITGFSVLTLVVASRVLLGHSGQSARFGASLPAVLVAVACVTLAMLTRVSADWLPALRLTHYGYAALVWMAGVLIWAFALLPSVRLSGED